jgi:hypothetical protein
MARYALDFYDFLALRLSGLVRQNPVQSGVQLGRNWRRLKRRLCLFKTIIDNYMKNFVFVLGAGASVDLNLPMGSELTGQIKQALSFKSDSHNISGGDATLRAALSSSSQNHPQWFDASKSIAAAMPLAPSIDNFVDVHRNDPSVAFCAKAAITKCILDAERKSTIYVDQSNIYNTINFQSNAKAWHTLFFRILTTNCVLEDLPERLQSIGIVSFNYDRCFEHFLFHAIRTYYRISANDACEILSHLEVYHPYGKVGALPYIQDTNHFENPAAIDYGAEPSPKGIVTISKQIRTFTESIDEQASDIIRIRDMVYETRNLVFLGFAFHSINVQLLFPFVRPDPVSYEKRIIATALGSSESDLRIIENDLRARYKCDRGAAELRNLTCDALFTEYSRTLSLS